VAGAGSHPLRRRPAILGCHVPGCVTRCIEHPQSRQEDTRREHRIRATIEKESEFLLTSPPTANAMSVTKRNGTPSWST
jgi:hypothetical protein